ncbi:MAG: hypothetical protein WA144_15440 [Candidatus Methanoperedens sp.]
MSYFDDEYGSYTLAVGETEARADYTIKLNSVTDLGRVADVTVTELNPTCTPWTCDPYKPGYEKDKCGNSRPNPACGTATHKECVNGSCVSVTGAGTDNCSGCSSTTETLKLSVDKIKFNTGDTITFTVSSTGMPDGTQVKLYERVPLGADFNVGSGIISGGSATITKTAGVDATLVYYVCNPGIFGCKTESNTVTIQIGGGSVDYWTYALILAVLVIIYLYSKELGLFQMIGQKR